MRYFFLFTFFISLFNPAWAKTIEYEFDIDYKTVNFTGTAIQAMAVGNQIPAPTIEATVGDTLKVTFHNKMNVESSIHWHGILLPNDQDGVPYLTTPPIPAKQSFTFEYPVTHSGTYWYHSHTGLQEQRGVYGSIVFHPEQGERYQADHDVVVVLSDWTDENPQRVLHNLKKSDDYYALKKDSVQSWLKVFQHGQAAVKSRLEHAWMRMGPMDLSDVGYDAFLANGQRQFSFSNIKADETVRIRLINAAASTYFNVQFSGGPMTIVAVDGVDVEAVKVNRQRMAIAETYDVIVTIHENQAYELRASAEDGTGYSSVILGQGQMVKAPDIPKPNLFLADHSMHGEIPMQHSSHNQHAHHQHHKMHDMPQQMQEYELLRAIEPSTFDTDKPKRTVTLELTGDMERYAWSFNNKVLSENSQILIKKGETVHFVLDNKTMMHHPLHLHGHFFRVLNGQGDYSPLKHTVNVPAMQTVVIEFEANEEKDWFFHCHNLYHMKSGMARVVSYEDSSSATEESLSPLFHDLNWFYFADVSLQNNASFTELRAENTRNAFNLEHQWDYEHNYKIELSYERYINRFLELYTGWEQEQEVHLDEKDDDDFVFAGLHYLLPLLVELDLRVDHRGHGRVGIANSHQLSDRLSFDWRANSDDEYRIKLNYELNKQFHITGGRDDRFDWGVGIEWLY